MSGFRACSSPTKVSSSNAETTIAVPMPTSVAGDQLIAVLSVSSTQSMTTTPSGWVLMATFPWVDNSSAVSNVWVYKKIATGSEPASYTWGWANSGGGIGTILSYQGAVLVDAECAGTPQASTSQTRTTPSVTTGGPRHLVSIFADANGSTYSGATDTQRVAATRTGGASLLVQDTNGLVAQGTYSKTATASVNTNVGVQVILSLQEPPFATPTGLTVTPASPTSIVADWDDTPSATSYDVQRRRKSDGAQALTTNVSSSTFTDTGLDPGTEYEYRVRAVK